MPLIMSAIRLGETNAILHGWTLYKEDCAESSGDKVRPAFALSATINGDPIEKLFADVTKAAHQVPQPCRRDRDLWHVRRGAR